MDGAQTAWMHTTFATSKKKTVGPSCSNLHTLYLWGGLQLRDISALGSCSNLHTLHLSRCAQLRDISALGSCSNLPQYSMIPNGK